ncbi:DUF1565 domain-containing protein [bacterium]|nr:DUF1565 domain-containing protein [bacterium]
MDAVSGGKQWWIQKWFFPAKRAGRIVSFLWVAITLSASHAATIYVDSHQTNQPPDGLSWETAFPTIRVSLELATTGDEVWVAEGRYPAFANTPSSFTDTTPLRIPTGVAVYGGFAGTEINRLKRNPTAHPSIIAGWLGASFEQFASPHTSFVTFMPDANNQTRLDGFRLEFNAANYGSAIYVPGGSPIIANNTIVSNRVDGPLGGSAIFVDRTAILQPMDPLQMFNQVAGRLFAIDGQVGSDGRPITFTNIMVWPTNDYRAAVHRVLQVAANMVDATTNLGDAYPYFPHVFRPYLRREVTSGRTNIYVAGIQWQDRFQEQNGTPVDPADLVKKSAFWDLSEPAVIDQIPETPNANEQQPLAIGLPLVIGAKKGFHNFNELAVETSIYLARYIQLRRPTIQSLPNQTNEFYVLGITNSFGVEAWNSYKVAYPRPLKIAVEVDFDMTLSGTNAFGADTNGVQQWPPYIATGGWPISTNFTAELSVESNAWQGQKFQIPLLTNHVFLSNSFWFPSRYPHFEPATTNVFSVTNDIPNQFPIPDWNLAITNRIRYAVLDGDHLVDFVNSAGLTWRTNLVQAMAGADEAGRDSQGSQFWDLSRRDKSENIAIPSVGMDKQMLVSLGYWTVSDSIWRNYGIIQYSTRDKDLAVDAFRRFATGQPPVNYPSRISPIDPTGLIAMAPFVPARKLVLRRAHEVDDPLVHFTSEDLAIPPYSADLLPQPSGWASIPSDQLRTIGRQNIRYVPWARGDSSMAIDETYREPLIYLSDDWEFSSGSILNNDWFDHIHRGTPWQTIYYGGGHAMIAPYLSDYSDSLTLPQNDWAWIEAFRKDWLGLPVVVLPTPHPVIVNNTIAANSAGNEVTGTAIHLEPGTSSEFVNNIVAFNGAGIEQAPIGSPDLVANDVYANVNGNYLGLSSGIRDQSVDPEFHNIAAGDFTLATTSPLIDTANPLPWFAGWLDANELSRFQNDHLDFGAAELSVDVPPELRLHGISGESFLQLDLNGFPRHRFRLEQSEDLSNWTDLGEAVTANGRAIIQLEPLAPRLFLRAKAADY